MLLVQTSRKMFWRVQEVHLFKKLLFSECQTRSPENLRCADAGSAIWELCNVKHEIKMRLPPMV